MESWDPNLPKSLGFLDKVDISKSKDDVNPEMAVKDWVKTIAIKNGVPVDKETNALLFTFGSYRLGIYSPGDDLDILCVGPSYVNREQNFFNVLDVTLAQMSEVMELKFFPNAQVPVIKFKFLGVSVDLCKHTSNGCTKAPYSSDETTLCCLNMCRVANKFLNLFQTAFQMTLRFVKHWAKEIGIYCNEMKMNDGWHHLCRPFLEAYSLYLYIKISANDEQDLKNWKGWIQPYWREFPSKIERSGMLHCHVYPHEYVDSSGCPCVYFVIGLSRIQPLHTGDLQLEPVTADFEQEIKQYNSRKTGMEFFTSLASKYGIVRLVPEMRAK